MMDLKLEMEESGLMVPRPIMVDQTLGVTLVTEKV